MSLDPSTRSRKRIRWGSAIGTAIIVLVLFVIFIVAVRWFRSEPEQEETVVTSIADVLKPDPISQAVIDGAIDTQSREATLYWSATGERVGTAARGDKDGRYYIDMKMTLPAIDRETQYYQVWLLSRLPYDFFSLGEMVTNDDGDFVLEWEAPDDEDYANYTQVIISRNAYDGSPDPEVQLVKGAFGI